jgi:hypothetical protein
MQSTSNKNNKKCDVHTYIKKPIAECSICDYNF